MTPLERIEAALSEMEARAERAEQALIAIQLSHARLEEALEFYAAPSTYIYSIEDGPEEGSLFISGPITKDNGAKATSALKKPE